MLGLNWLLLIFAFVITQINCNKIFNSFFAKPAAIARDKSANDESENKKIKNLDLAEQSSFEFRIVGNRSDLLQIIDYALSTATTDDKHFATSRDFIVIAIPLYFRNQIYKLKIFRENSTEVLIDSKVTRTNLMYSIRKFDIHILNPRRPVKINSVDLH